jgi:DNA-binding MurR/RpiR family transcriptional regulator
MVNLREKASVIARGAATVSSAPARSHHSPCLATLRGAHPALTEAERRVADFVLADPDLALHSSITQVARASGVGLSTVSRLSTKLGYAGFPDMKIALAVELLNPDHGTPEPVDAADDTATVARKVLRYGAQNLLDTAALLDPLELERAGRAITRARRVELYAVGIVTGAIARSAEARIRLLQVPCTAVIDQYEHEPRAALLGPGDVAIGVSYSGDTPEVVRAVGVARDMGATTVCLTKGLPSPLAEVAAIRLLVASHEAGRWGNQAASRIAMLGVVEALYAVAVLLKHRQEPGSARHRVASREECAGALPAESERSSG